MNTMSAGVATRRQRPFTAAQQTAARSRVPGLDGVRAVAVLLVVSSHTALTPLLNPGGSFGVTVFFVLSGYLITGLLLAEFRRNGRIDLRRFWLRRALRLLPALWVMLTVISLLARHERWLSWRQLRSAVGPGLFYYADYVPAAQLYLFGHTWSLAVEEQFYVLWPLVIIGLGIAARRRRWILGSALVALTAVGIAWRLHVGGNPENRAGYDAAVRHLDTCGFALVAGAVLATMPLARPGRAPRIPGWVPAVAFLGTLAICDRSHQLHLRLNGVTAPLLFTVPARGGDHLLCGWAGPLAGHRRAALAGSTLLRLVSVAFPVRLGGRRRARTDRRTGRERCRRRTARTAMRGAVLVARRAPMSETESPARRGTSRIGSPEKSPRAELTVRMLVGAPGSDTRSTTSRREPAFRRSSPRQQRFLISDPAARRPPIAHAATGEVVDAHVWKDTR